MPTPSSISSKAAALPGAPSSSTATMPSPLPARPGSGRCRPCGPARLHVPRCRRRSYHDRRTVGPHHRIAFRELRRPEEAAGRMCDRPGRRRKRGTRLQYFHRLPIHHHQGPRRRRRRSQPTDRRLYPSQCVPRHPSGCRTMAGADPDRRAERRRNQCRLRTRIEHNLFYRAEGDREAVSIKTPGTTLRWNVFRDIDAAPNIRGSRDAVVSDNLLIRTRPIRINGSDHRVEGNVVLCPSAGVGFVVSHGSPGYETAANTLIRNNVVATNRVGILFGAQRSPSKQWRMATARLEHVSSAEEPSDLRYSSAAEPRAHQSGQQPRRRPARTGFVLLRPRGDATETIERRHRWRAS